MSQNHALRRTLLAAGAVSTALALSACGSGAGGTSGGGGTNFVTSEGGIATVAKDKRQAAGALVGETLDGSRLDVAALKGKVVVLNIWGSWCPPCRAEAPHFAKVSKDLKSKGAEFVGLNTRDFNKQPALAFEEEFKVAYPSLYDPHGELILRGFPKGTLIPNGIPSTIILDRDGKIAARAAMAVDEEQLRSMIDPLIAEK
ncbi:TlpA family protein disulfide reductase [Streptomyces sp. NPDC059247]|uniref:TlpA family protein disulfide reductase n=1 Tax=Streptomyces sp. NPDC059247 TaxID=3346790 RepID=UPI0036CA1E39